MGTMKLLPVTILCLLSTLRRSDGNPVDGTATTPALSQSTVAATRTSVPTPTTTPSPSPTLKSTVTSPKGTPSPESFKTSPPTVSSLNTTVSGEEATTSVTKGEFITTNTTVTSLPVSDAVSTLQSSHNKTENQNSTKTTERTVLEPGRSRCQQIQCLLKSCFLDGRPLLLTVTSHGRKGKAALRGLLHKGANLIHEGSAFMT
ncbi:endomucin isoform X4 [Equus asinus]|uniref:endomucin isoform X4 n=1 Tax=Equus asinus TaxID=9793 RepID=UPI0038F7BDC1